VSVINGATCNATDTAGCHRAQPKFPVGRAPEAVTIDPMTGTVYTSNRDDTVSIIPYPGKARARNMPGRTLRALIADRTGVKAAPEPDRVNLVRTWRRGCGPSSLAWRNRPA
jgi:DNA-binding beta-propeller fold protein YncE